MIAFIRIHDQQDISVECSRIIVLPGATLNVNNELWKFLIVVTDNKVYEDVIDIEVL